jgi:hypothetical protein
LFLVLENPFSFGGGDRYYASATAPDPGCLAAVGGKVTGAIADLLNEYDPELERQVSRSFRQWNNVLRDQFRNEMGNDVNFGAHPHPIRCSQTLLPTR